MRKALLLIFPLVIVVGQVPLQATDTRPPNIILILADDLGYGDVGAYGGTTVKYNKTDLKPSDMQMGTGRLPPPKEGWSADSPLGQITLLYDLDNDPGETTNLATDHPEIVKRLQSAYDAWSKGLGEPIIPALRSTLIQVEGENIQLIF